jgi:peptide/nickel transport system ATP-binding protein
MWVTDLFLSLPQLPLLLLVIYLFREQLKAMCSALEGGVFILIVVGDRRRCAGCRWPGWFARSSSRCARRSSSRPRKALGAIQGRARSSRHILPNALGPVIVAATIEVIAAAIIAESTLSFLGLGFPPDIPTWGRLLFDAKDNLDFAPHWALFPGAAIFLTVAVDQLHRRRPARRARPAPRAVSRILDISGLKVHFRTDDGWVRAVDGVDIGVDRGETVSIVGESGCGKTVTAKTVLKLIDMPPGKIVAGSIVWQGRDLVPATPAQMRAIRAKEIGFIFQEPMTSLNPVYTVGEQIAESVRQHEGLSRRAAMDRAAEMLALVNIPNPASRVHDYPHQFSGGMRQRVMIAMALACNPKLVIADEPTTALDVTIQAQILDLLAEMKQRIGMAVLLITHAMGVVAENAQRVIVMYAGKVVEEAPVGPLFATPLHPYTQGLIRSIPRLDLAATEHQRLEAIPGTVPSLLHPPPGCRFAARCRHATEECRAAEPALRELSPGHKVACIHAEAIAA